MTLTKHIDLARAACSVLCAMSFFLGASLSAQDPFGDFGAPPAGEKQPVAPQPNAPAAKAAAKSKADPKNAEPAIDPSSYSLPVRAVLEGNPQTPAQLLRATSVLLDFDEPKLAKRFLMKLHGAGLDEAALAGLVRQLGSGPFLKIAGHEAMQPEGREIGDRAIAAASRAARDPKRLAALVEQLADPSAEVQRRAIAELLAAHEHAAPPLLAILNEPAKETVHRRAFQALVALGQDAVQPLIGALNGPDGSAKQAALRALSNIRASEAVPFIVALYASPKTSQSTREAAAEALLELHGKVPSSREAVRYLQSISTSMLASETVLPANPDGSVELWVWDSIKGQPTPAELSTNQARSMMAARLARAIFELSPDDPRHRRLYLVSILAADAYAAGLDNPVSRDEGSAFAAAAALGVDAVEDALVYAMNRGYTAAATVAAEVLGEIGDASILTPGGAEPSSLAKALLNGDVRLRFAAAQAIARLRPTTHFAGASDLQRTLVHLATSGGARRALVGFPNRDTAQKLAGLVNSLGFQTDTATNGRELALMATQGSEPELLLISSRIERGPLYLVVQDLRNHPHTSKTPIIVLAEDDEKGLLAETVQKDPLTSVAFRSRDLAGMKYAVDLALGRAGDHVLPAAVRERQAIESLKAINELRATAPKVFDFRSDEGRLAPLLYVPTLAASVAEVFSGFGTHTSQRSLLDIVNRTSQPLASRQPAALAFADSVRRFRVRLTKGEIIKQYERYNQSRFEDRATQELLSAVLDAIELPAETEAATANASSTER